MLQIQSLLGIFFFLGVTWFFSKDRSSISYKIVINGIFFQFALALLVLGVPSLGFPGPLRFAFEAANDGILTLLSFTEQGSSFIFGDLIKSDKFGLIIAFQVLPIIIFLSALMTTLYHLGVMQFIVNLFAIVMQKLLGISGAESLAAAANVFIGQTEAPLIVRPYLKKMTESELFSLMTGGMATIAGSVMAAYVGFLKDLIPGIGGHLLTASILSAPAALVIAKIMLPETQKPETLGVVPKDQKKMYVNLIDAAANGAIEGMKLAVNVAAMLLAFVALIALVDSLFIFAGDLVGFGSWGVALTPEYLLKDGQAQFSLSFIMSWLFTPVAFFLGIPWEDMSIAGTIIGKKIAFNEFIAYMDMASMGEMLKPRTTIILSYALCGFANFSSIAIQIGGIGALIPDRKQELAIFGIRSVIGGSLAAFITASIAGLLI
ncbi:MAG: NupC/NupG family nucleoside CNT transporter [Bdellovibrionales bacterium]|nr:NupC/NupG family nucleoside CNT transporter [Bdellovibrionales bacterium]